jgi:RND family efflux transporter MFP subunit
MNRFVIHGLGICGWGFVVGIMLVGCHRMPAIVPPAVHKVDAALPIEKEVVDHEDFTGQTDAVSRVDIRARVSGYLVKVNFKDGDIVKQGTLLYQIDPRPFQAALDQANGTLERLVADKALLDIQVDRYRKLAEKGAGSQQDLDQYLAQQAENIGAINSAKAQIEIAQLNLDFTRIESPISGKISRTLLTEGNLVVADNTLLTTLMSIDPIYAYFNIEEPTLLRLVKMKREGLLPHRQFGMTEVSMGLADDVHHEFPMKGVLDFSNNTVDSRTGTILVRGRFENPFEFPDKPPLMLPGLFIRARLNIGTAHKTCLVTERAIGTDQGKKYVYVLDDNDKVVYRPVTLGLVFDGLQAIESGLTPADRVVVNGLQRVRPGAKVEPELCDMAKLAAPD